jgi:AraC-like DNA-binding protein
MLSAIRINDIIGVNRLEHKPLSTTYSRDWENYALTIKKVGRTVYETPSGNRYLTDPYHMLLLRKGLKSTIHTERGECITIEFSGMLSESLPEVTSFYLSKSLVPVEILEKLESEWTFRRPSWQNQCMSALYQLFALLERTEEADHIPIREYHLLRPVLEYINHEYGDPDISNEILAKQINMSVSYFLKQFKKIFHSTPMKYLQNFRIDRAKEMLTTEMLSVAQISEMVGFSTPFYFDVVFKKETGITPSDYIRLNLISGL